MNRVEKSEPRGEETNQRDRHPIRQFVELVQDNWAWLLSCTLITGIASVLRFVSLELRPMHHDEGVNGHFLINLFRDGVYEYDPANYHGPDLYYFSLGFVKLFGLNTATVRFSVAVFGVLTVVLAFFLRRYIGTIGSLSAASFLAVAPGMVFISRYFIHEIIFVFFSLSLVIAVLFFMEKNSAGIFAVGWMTLLLLVCFVPASLKIATYAAADNSSLLWPSSLIILVIESVFIFFVMRMLSAWDNGRPIYLMLASASLVFLFATKETAFITVGTMLISALCVRFWQILDSRYNLSGASFNILMYAHFIFAIAAIAAGYFFFDRLKGFYTSFYLSFAGPDVPDQRIVLLAIILLAAGALFAWRSFLVEAPAVPGESSDRPRFVDSGWRDFRMAFGEWKHALIVVIAGIVIFIYVGVLFFSSFFTYPDGLKGAFEAYAIWAKTGSKDHTQNGLIAYIKWIAQIESPLIILSILGTLMAIIRAKHRVAMFTGLWAFGLFIAYSIIPYKTPWLALSFTLPMCIIAGYAVNELAVSSQRLNKILAAVLTLLALFIFSFQTYDLNFVRYDSDRLPYVYAHTERGYNDLIEQIKRYSEKSEKGKDVTIEIVTPQYWPMPWSLKDYPLANFHGGLVDSNTSEMIVASESQRGKLAEKYAAHYKYAGSYPLRPGVKLYLLIRNDLAEPQAIPIDRIAD